MQANSERRISVPLLASATVVRQMNDLAGEKLYAMWMEFPELTDIEKKMMISS